MHLAYLDDSDTKAKQRKWQVMSGVLIDHRAFKLVEVGMTSIPQDLIPPERLEKFEEFHACELYGGYGVFEGISQETRFAAIRRLLGILGPLELKVVYGAVDLSALQRELFASADPLDICFRICLSGVDYWANDRIHEAIAQDANNDSEGDPVTRVVLRKMLEDLVLLILDECDSKSKTTLVRSFRQVRPTFRSGKFCTSCLHDDMYFGDSRYSLGIQLADLCSYFIARHLEGDQEIDGFYEWIEPHIVYSQIHPSSAIPAPIDEINQDELPLELDRPLLSSAPGEVNNAE